MVTLVKRIYRAAPLMLNRILKTHRLALFVKTSTLSRRGLYDYLRDSIIASGGRIRPQGSILTIGAGGGVDELINTVSASIGTSVISVDIDLKRDPVVVCDVRNLPFSDSAFDCVVCAEVLEHVLYPHESVCEMHRVPGDGGTLILTTRFIFPLHGRPSDYFRYTKYGLAALLGGFSKVDIREHLSWMETMAVLVMRLLGEDNRWVELLATPIYWSGKVIDLAAKTVGRWLPTDYMACGYLAVAQK